MVALFAICMLAVVAWCMACAVKPELSWKVFERWKSYRADEPSDAYLLLTRIGAIVGAVMGAAAIAVVIYLAAQPEEPIDFAPKNITIKAYDSFGNQMGSDQRLVDSD